MINLTNDMNMVFMELTNRCNFDCLFCPSGISKREKTDMDRKMAFNIIEQLKQLEYNKKLYFHVLGEPLLHPDIFSIVNYSAKAGMKPILFTNGGALEENTVDKILNSKAHEVVISMQTINKESYENLRKTPFSWNEYLGRIQQALKRANNKKENNIPFRVSIGIKKQDSVHPGDEYFTEYESKNQINESISKIFNATNAKNLEKVYSFIREKEIKNILSQKISENIYFSIKEIGNWRRVWDDKPTKTGSCLFAGREIAVLADGSITFCHIDYDGRTTIGNINERSLIDILTDESISKMFSKYINENIVPKGCQYCNAVYKSEK